MRYTTECMWGTEDSLQVRSHFLPRRLWGSSAGRQQALAPEQSLRLPYFKLIEFCPSLYLNVRMFHFKEKCMAIYRRIVELFKLIHCIYENLIKPMLLLDK